MKIACSDIFEALNLPFETYFVECVNHEDIVHDQIEIIWVLKGLAHIKIEGKTYQLEPKTVFMVYMNQKHAITSSEGTIIISYRLNNAYLHQRGLHFEKIKFIPRVNTFEYLAQKYRQVPLLLVQILKISLSHDNHEAIRHKIMGYYNFYVFELYSILLKERYLDIKNLDYDKYLRRVHTIVEYIYKHFHEKIQLNDLALITNCSTYHLSHFIKDALGISFYDFLQKTRFECAINLLENTDLSLEHIVKKSGFSDPKYLSLMMKKNYGMTPLKYKKTMSKKETSSHLFDDDNPFIKEIKSCLKSLEEDPIFSNLFEFEKTQNMCNFIE